MREIKFRAWDKKENKLVYELESEFTDTGLRFYSIDMDGDIGYIESVTGCDETNLDFGTIKDRFMLMQYTGLKDKNGKEIYEGDIVKANFDDIKYKEIKEFNSEVIFGYGQFYVCHNSIVYPVFDIFAHIEMIGNIYENPELMK